MPLPCSLLKGLSVVVFFFLILAFLNVFYVRMLLSVWLIIFMVSCFIRLAAFHNCENFQSFSLQIFLPFLFSLSGVLITAETNAQCPSSGFLLSPLTTLFPSLCFGLYLTLTYKPTVPCLYWVAVQPFKWTFRFFSYYLNNQ